MRLKGRSCLVLGSFLVVLVVIGLSRTQPAVADATGRIEGEVTARPSKLRAGVVVHVVKAAGSFRPPASPVRFDQRDLKFVPHVLPILKGTTVRFFNSDNVNHNVFSPDGERYDMGSWSHGQSRDRVFDRAGPYVQLCNVHPEMNGYIVVLDNPYFAVTGADGRYRIDGVPPGNYTLRAWSERLRATTKPVTVAAGAAADVPFELAR